MDRAYLPPAQCQHPHCILCHLLILPHQLLSFSGCHRNYCHILLHKGTAAHQDVRRTLGEHQQLSALGAHNDRHHLALGVKRQLPQNGAAAGAKFDSAFHGSDCKGSLGRLSIHLQTPCAHSAPAVLDACIAAHRRNLQCAPKVAVILCQHCPACDLQSAVFQPVSADLKPSVPAHQLLDCHAVFCQCPCFVRADYIGTTECFHRVQPPNHRILLDHPVDRKRQRDGNNGRQALRDGCHCQRDTGNEHLHHRLSAQDSNARNQCADDKASDCNALAQLVEFFL